MLLSPKSTARRSPSRASTYAAIDLGSNSFHLLVGRFEGDRLLVLDRHKEMVRLGAGLQADGSLSPVVMNRALAGLERLAERVRPVPQAYIRVVGTNTLRIATNSDAFLVRAEAILGVPVSIVSGLEEARLTYLGVAKDFSPTNRTRLVVDIGGGSTELVLGRGSAPICLESLSMGSVSFSRRFFPDGALSRRAYERALVAARAEMQDALGRFGNRRWYDAVGSSGTIRAIERVLDRLGYILNHVVTIDGIEQLAETVLAARRNDRLALPGLDADRRDVFVGGLAVLHAVFAELQISEMHVSQYALREGILYDLAGRAHNADKRVETIKRMMTQYHVDRAQVRRVGKLTLQLFDQVAAQVATEPALARRLLQWAVSLHEIGLSVAHGGYHRHGGYLVSNSDMPGFSRQEQQLLGLLVGNHRRKPKSEEDAAQTDWRLVAVLRLACLLLRRRDETLVPGDIRLRFQEGLQESRCRLSLPRGWLAEHPLTREDLLQERKHLATVGIDLVLGSHARPVV